MNKLTNEPKADTIAQVNTVFWTGSAGNHRKEGTQEPEELRKSS